MRSTSAVGAIDARKETLCTGVSIFPFKSIATESSFKSIATERPYGGHSGSVKVGGGDLREELPFAGPERRKNSAGADSVEGRK